MIADEIETNSTSEMDISEEEDLVLTAFLGENQNVQFVLSIIMISATNLGGYQLLGDMTMTASTS